MDNTATQNWLNALRSGRLTLVGAGHWECKLVSELESLRRANFPAKRIRVAESRLAAIRAALAAFSQ